MGYLNKVSIIGNLGNDLELKTTGSGLSVVELRIATKYKEDTEWTSCICWRKEAEIAAKYLKKGDQVAIIGRLKTRKWAGKDGVERYKTEVIVTQLILIGDKRDGSSTRSHANNFQEPSFQPEVNIDAIPF